MLIGAGFFFRLAKHTADGQIWAACGMGVSRLAHTGSYAPISKFHLELAASLQKKVHAPLCHFNSALTGMHSKGFFETVTLRKIQWILAISLCDGLGWLAAAGSIGFYFARLLGCLSCLPA